MWHGKQNQHSTDADADADADSNANANADSNANADADSDSTSRQVAADFNNLVPSSGFDCTRGPHHHHKWYGE
jgi:hypothetical protein